MDKKESGFSLQFEGETSVLVLWGDIQEPEMRELIVKLREHWRRHPYTLSICDLSRFDSVSPAARKLFADASHDMNTRGSALYGASFQTRIIATLVMKAASLLSKRDNPMLFCETEAEAREWLNQKRKDLLKEQSRKQA
jgi:hypothetical protein